MISKWRVDYTDEEKDMALTILNKNQEINKLVDKLEEQEQHIKEANFEIERLNNIINEALRKLRATKDHYKIEDINNAIIYTIRILKRSDKE